MDVLPSSQTPLCFNRHEFTKENFCVETFLAQTRSHVSLNQIKDDLHLYLKILQNAMIELINKDYAEFVNLSTNLVNIKPSIDKFQNNIDVLSCELATHADRLSNLTDSLTDKTSNLRIIRESIDDYQQRCRRLKALDKLNLLADRELDIQLIERVTVIFSNVGDNWNEDESLLLPMVEKYQNKFISLLINAIRNSSSSDVTTLLKALASCGRLNAAQAAVVKEIIEAPLNDCIQRCRGLDKFVQLQNVFDTLKSINDQYSAFFNGINASNAATESRDKFLHDCIFSTLLHVIDQHFAEITIPTETSTFQKCYRAMNSFPPTIGSSSSHPIFKITMKKFSFTIYMQLIGQDIRRTLETAYAKNDKQKIFGSSTTSAVKNNETVITELTQICLSSLKSLWTSEVFLEAATADFWELSCQIVNRHFEWLTNLTSSLSEQEVEQMLLLYIDTLNYNDAVKDVYDNLIWPKLQYIFSHIDVEEQQRPKDTIWQSMQTVLQDQLLTVQNLKAVISRVIVEQMCVYLAQVSEIPRQYRWTRKESPNECSAYIRQAFDCLSPIVSVDSIVVSNLPVIFRVDLIRSIIESIIPKFVDGVLLVLESVEKISSSLGRLKATGTAAAAQNTTPGRQGDDAKIRQQLRLDFDEFCNQIILTLPPDLASGFLNQLNEVGQKLGSKNL